MSMSDKVCSVSASTKSNDGCEVNDMLQNMSTADGISVCANCGKEDSNINNKCNKCNQAKYCNVACKKKHRQKHKKECERYMAEQHDRELFKQQPSPPLGDCPICFLRIPTLQTGFRYYSCCGKIICRGCDYAPVLDDHGNIVTEKKCPFCRTPLPDTDEDERERLKVRMEAGDPEAIHNVGFVCRDGTNGYPQDYTKALELWHRAAKLGHADAYTAIGYSHENGRGVEVNKKMATHYYELAAMGGNAQSRHNLGVFEEDKGNLDRAVKHYTIAVRGGHNESLKEIQDLFSKGHATKDVYTKALQSYQAYLGEIKSVQRDKAAAADEENYY